INARYASECLLAETQRPSQNEFSKTLFNLSGHVGIPQRIKLHTFRRSWHGQRPEASHPEGSGQLAL
ncbi:MAG: hypothetical protein WBQ20_07595, partial [Methyloceanibacter sp.]